MNHALINMLPQIYLWHDIQDDKSDDIAPIGHPHVDGFCQECGGACRYDEDGFAYDEDEDDNE